MALEQTATGWKARWREPGGKQRAKTFRTKTEAKDHLAKMHADQLRGEYSSRVKAPPLRQIADEWLAAAFNLSPVTHQTYRRDLDRYVLPALGDWPADKITAPAIQKWMTDEMKRLAPSSVHRHYRTLRTLMGFALRMGYIPKNPCDLVVAPKIPKTEQTFLTADQVRAIADNIAPRYRAWVLVAGYGGLRWGEMCGLRRMDIDGARVTVAGQLQKIGNQWQRIDPKWNSRRTLTLPASVAEELAQHLATYTGSAPTDLVFVNQQGNPVGPSFRHNVWAPACVKAGLGTEEWVRTTSPRHGRNFEYHRKFADIPSPHDLRHTAAALAIATGAHPKAIQQRLGHSTIQMTMDTYGHLMAGLDEALAARLDDL